MKRFNVRWPMNGVGMVKTIIVDDCDAYLLRSVHWRLLRKGGHLTVVERFDQKPGENDHRTLGARIMGSKLREEVVWHANGDDCDFRRENLRVSSVHDRAVQRKQLSRASE